MEDALGDRSWVDNEHCKPFVDNILMSFGTVLPTKPTTGDQSKKETQSVSIGKLKTPNLNSFSRIMHLLHEICMLLSHLEN